MKTHTLRGRVREQTVKRLIIDDGRLTHAMKITKFIITPGDIASSHSCSAVLGLQGNFPGAIFNFSDNNQIAWASALHSQNALDDAIQPGFSLVDRDHIVIRDLYIYGIDASGGNQEINYYIEMEAVDISHDESILQLIKERSQGELRA